MLLADKLTLLRRWALDLARNVAGDDRAVFAAELRRVADEIENTPPGRRTVKRNHQVNSES